MPSKNDNSRRDSVSMVGFYARIRIVIAVVIFAIAFAVIGYRAIVG